MRNDELSVRLTNVLIAMKEDIEKHKEKEQKKLWKKIEHPLTFIDFLKGLTVDELKQMADNLDVTGISALKKEQLAEAMHTAVKGRIRNVFRKSLIVKELKLIEQINLAGGTIHYTNEEIEMLFHLRELGIVFTGTLDKKKIITIPEELRECISAELNDINRKIITNRDKWIKVSRGILYYYGMLLVGDLRQLASNFLDEEISHEEYFELLGLNMKYIKKIKNYGMYIYYEDINSPKEILKNIEAREMIDYYPLTLNMVLEAGEEDFIYWDKYQEKVLRILKKSSKVSEDILREKIVESINLLKNGYKFGIIFSMLTNLTELKDINEVNELAGYLTEINNNLRLWELKGHTPNEIHKTEKANLSPLSKSNLTIIKNNVIGRNDPCPCGSGKKYKKCCGYGNP